MSSSFETSLPVLDLTQNPTRHPDCCLSLSTHLLDILARIICDVSSPNHTSTLLSVGSGTGLLEALLMIHLQSHFNGLSADESLRLSVEGIEVQQMEFQNAINKYLPEQAINTARGTWHVSPRLQDSDITALMFVYPRQPDLVSRYMDCVCTFTSSVRVIIWIGPRADWTDFEDCFKAKNQNSYKTNTGHFEVVQVMHGEDAGIDLYEMMVVLKRRSEITL